MNCKKAWKSDSRWALGGLIAFSGGCSFFYELNSNQCERNSDCAAIGNAFRGSECVNRVCVLPSAGNGGNDAGVSGGGVGGGGVSGSGGGGTAGTGDTGGGGVGGMPECTTNAECIAANNNLPYLCREEHCVPLVTDECPLLIPTATEQWSALDALKEYEPLLLGAFSGLNRTTPKNTLSVLSWEYALTEINEATLGGPTIDGERRPILALVCTSNGDVVANTNYMVGDVGVPAILSTLSPAALIEAFETDAATESEPLFLSALSADIRLISMMDGGRVWHMLGNPRTIAAPVAALVKKVEPLVRARRQAFWDAPANASTRSDDPTTPVRVLLVRSDIISVSDIADLLVSAGELEARPQNNLVFNGVPAFDAANEGNFAIANIESASVSMTPDVSDLMVKVRALKPHIIVAMATREFLESPQALQAVEEQWNAATTPIAAGQERPFYVLSQQLVFSDEALTGLTAAFSNRQLGSRIVGVNFAANATAAGLKATYVTGITNAYPGSPQATSFPDSENFYDAAYYLSYALLGSMATGLEPTGPRLATALETRVLNTQAADSVSQVVGSSAVPDIVPQLLDVPRFRMKLTGTLGPPNFDTILGTRNSEMSAWCVELNNATPRRWVRRSDVALYDDVDHEFRTAISCVPDP